MNLKQHEWFPKLQKNTIGTWKKQCFLELTWNLKKHDFQNLDDIRSATRAGHCNRVALAAVDSVAFGLRVISLARKRPPPGSDRNRHWTFFRSNCKITGGIEVSPLRNEYWMYCMSHVWEWIISEFEQIVPIATWTPLKGLKPGISCSEKRTKAWEKPSFNKSWQQKNYPNYIHPSTIEKSSVFLRAINFHPLSTWKLLT